MLFHNGPVAHHLVPKRGLLSLLTENRGRYRHNGRCVRRLRNVFPRFGAVRVPIMRDEVESRAVICAYRLVILLRHLAQVVFKRLRDVVFGCVSFKEGINHNVEHRKRRVLFFERENVVIWITRLDESVVGEIRHHAHKRVAVHVVLVHAERNGGKHLGLHTLYIQIEAVRYRQNERKTDYAYAAGKGREEGPAEL